MQVVKLVKLSNGKMGGGKKISLGSMHKEGEAFVEVARNLVNRRKGQADTVD